MLRFPNFESLELALRSKWVPAEVADSSAVVLFEPGGAILVSPSRALSRAQLRTLSKIGVAPLLEKRPTGLPRLVVTCWAQIAGCRRDRAAELVGPTTPVLFDLPGSLVPELAGEILRLGNDRQGIRWLADEGGKSSRALLRVIGPPYYALLRAIDRGEDSSAPRAHVERASGVWVEVGHEYPWLDFLQPPPGKLLLISHPREWEFVEEGPFRDIYEAVDFELPTPPRTWRDGAPGSRFRVALRLARGGAKDPAELWVIQRDALGKLDELVRDADDRLLARLAFAVARASDHDNVDDGAPATVILRVRPSKLPPPVLVLDAMEFRAYLRLPNLFLPVETRLHPPLRRDAVSRLMASDPARITWLVPGSGGAFTPVSVPDEAFRPLNEWVDHVVERDHHALAAWTAACRFEFEPFICRDDLNERPADPKRTTSAPRPRGSSRLTKDASPTRAPRISRRDPGARAMEPRPTATVEPGVALRRLGELEAAFEAMREPLDHPDRASLWVEMADHNAALERHADAAVCWANARWEVATAPPEWLDAWSDAERNISGRRLEDAGELDRLLAEPKPTSSDVRCLATRLMLAARAGEGPSASPLVSRSSRIQGFLERNEFIIPARVAWLAWLAMASLMKGDVLALARARDRLLERLHQGGLNRELDLPSFLRHGSGAQGDRARVASQALVKLQGMARLWSGHDGWAAPHTGAISDLMFAFGLARTGDAAGSKALLARGLERMPGKDAVTHWLGQAFDHRIRQALEGKSAMEPLPVEMMKRLDDMGRVGNEERRERDRVLRYKIDRLREHSTILEPHERIAPYRHWHGTGTDEVTRDLGRVVDLTDRDEMRRVMDRLLALKPQGGDPAIRESNILGTALEVSYRLGEAFARRLYDRVISTVDAQDQFSRRARLLERAIPLAAHFDQPGYVRAYVLRFESLLATVTPRDHKELEPVLRSCFRGLRKLGLRDVIDRLLERMSAAVLGGGPDADLGDLGALAVRSGPGAAAWSQALRLLLHVAAGWCYFGQPERAVPVLDEARVLLHESALSPLDQTGLACAYVRSLGHAPTSLALSRLEEMFTTLRQVHDTYTVNSHYSLSRLDVIEAVVLTLASEEFTLGQSGLRWLEDDEYLVRRRIHRDVRAALGESA